MKTMIAIVSGLLVCSGTLIAGIRIDSNDTINITDQLYFQRLGIDTFPSEAQVNEWIFQKTDTPQMTKDGSYAMSGSKRIAVLGFLCYHHDKYPSAKEAVFTVFKEAKIESGSYIHKLAAAETLSHYGDARWIPDLQQEIDDPNSPYDASSKIRIAGQMAHCGDLSKLDYVASYLNDKNKYARETAVRNLKFFVSLGDSETEDQALDLLTFAGKTDSDYDMRDVVIQMLQISEMFCSEKAKKESGSSLYRLEQKKAKIQAKMKEVIESNLDSPNEELKTTCQILMQYKFKDK